MFRAKPNKPCEICGSPFYAAPCLSKIGKGRFCSSKCRVYWFSQIPLAVRFKAKLGETTESGCILWSGKKNKHGYGLICRGNKSGEMLAHRAAFLIANGSFDESFDVCHSCDNPSCVNHEHLFLGTAADNADDMKSKGRQSRGEGRPLAVLTESLVKELRIRWLDHVPMDHLCVQLAQEYGLKTQTVYNVISHRLWKHVS